MPQLLKYLLMQNRYMAPADDQGGAGGADLDDDLEDDPEEQQGEQKDEQQGNQETVVDDGSVEIELDDEQTEQQNDEQQNGEGGEDEKEREAIREARRKERQERKQRQKEREESARRELAAERAARKELEARLAAIEGKDRSRELAAVDEQIRRAASQYNYHKQVLQQAHEQHDGAAAADATEKMIAARDQFTRLSTVKQTFEQQQAQQGNPGLDKRLVSNANKFMAEHNWYKPGTNDRDTLFVRAIDDELASEGWDPKSNEYWDELRSRVKKFLPHRFASGKVSTSGRTDAQQAPQQRKSVVTGGGEGTAPAAKNVFKLSAERVAALKEAGMWDDPKKRSEAVKRFRDFDKQNTKG